jgi:hypothetical protein
MALVKLEIDGIPRGNSLGCRRALERIENLDRPVLDRQLRRTRTKAGQRKELRRAPSPVGSAGDPQRGPADRDQVVQLLLEFLATSGVKYTLFGSPIGRPASTAICPG